MQTILSFYKPQGESQVRKICFENVEWGKTWFDAKTQNHVIQALHDEFPRPFGGSTQTLYFKSLMAARAFVISHLQGDLI